MSSTAFFVLIGLVALGLLLIVVGRRGWRINDHPICRQCEFDLIGAYPGIVTCPECGAGLKREGWVRTGARRRPGVLVAAGGLLILLPVLPLGVYVYAGATGTNLNKYKPMGLLLWEARHAPAATTQAIAEELQDRMVTGKLSKAQTATAVGSALELQADPKRAWHDAWGGVISQAMLSGDLSKEQQKQFRENAAVLVLECRGAVRPGDALPLVVKAKEARVAADSTYLAMVGLKTASLGGKSLALSSPEPAAPATSTGWFGMFSSSVPVSTQMSQYLYLVGTKSRMAGWGPSESELSWTLRVPPDAKPGRTTVEVEVRMTVMDWGTGNTRQPGDPLRAKQGKYRAVTLRVPVEVTGADVPGVQPVSPTPELEKELKELLRPEQAWTYSPGQGTDLQFNIGRVPVPICFDVFSKDATGKERRIGVLSSGRGQVDRFGMGYSYMQAGQRHLHGSVGKLKNRKTELIFRPSAAAALRTVDLTRIYNGEITVADVEVQRQDDSYSFGGTTTSTSKGQDEEDDTEDAPQSPLPGA